MEWRLFADIAEAAGEHSLEINIKEDATVQDALDALLTRHPELEDTVMDNGMLADHLTILKNGKNVAGEDDGLDTAVQSDDELALFPPISGG